MKVLLGVTGGIAAYKAAELVRALQSRGIDVQVAMTASAEEFIRPLTFAALTGKPVLGSLWQPDPQSTSPDFDIEHIAVAQQIDALVIAPATANTLAKLAHGVADDLLTAVYLATRAPVVVAPAMNVNMWEHPATQANVRTLESRGAVVIPPGAGYLACGMTGGGRLADLDTIADAVAGTLAQPQDLAGHTVLITAGGTREPIDAVRFLGNRSSGRMGHALAAEALARGAHVILVTASTLPGPARCDTVRVDTASQMLAAVRDRLSSATIVVKAAAVADFRLPTMATGKLRRGGQLTLHLEPTEDILAEIVANRQPGTLVVGFAAEIAEQPSELLAAGRRKLLRKGVDALVVNDVSGAATGFDADENAGWFLTAGESIELPRSSKRHMAERIFDLTLGLRTALPRQV